MRIGLVGGTFDPPHVGHLVVAECARVDLGLDEVRLLVAGDPWMKSTVAPAEVRARLVALAVAGSPGMTCDDRETRRPGATYTVETLEELAADEPDATWHFVLGADAAATLADWHRADDLARLASLVVVPREGCEVAADMATLPVPHIGVSSSDLRRRYAEGRATRHLVPPAVDDEIRRLGIYGAGEARAR